MRTSFLTTVALLGLSVSPVFAADMVLRGAPPIPVAAVAPVLTPWTGCYVGANAGWIRSETSVSFNGVADFSRSQAGGAFGGQIGCDFQFSNWVIGIQGLVDGTNIEIDRDSILFPNTSLHAKVDRFSTITGRLGYAISPAFLLYGKLGWGSYTTSLTATNTLTGAQLGTVDSTTSNGLDLGVGGEWMFARNFSLWLEWNHIVPKDSSVAFANLAGGTAANVRRDLDKFLVGVNWRFGGGKAPVYPNYY